METNRYPNTRRARVHKQETATTAPEILQAVPGCVVDDATVQAMWTQQPWRVTHRLRINIVGFQEQQRLEEVLQRALFASIF